MEPKAYNINVPAVSTGHADGPGLPVDMAIRRTLNERDAAKT